MGAVDLLRFPDDSALAEAAAARWLAALELAHRCGRPHHVALSGGRIARRFFDAVVAHAAGRESLLERVHFFWADERCVPPDDPESNFRLAFERLLRPLNIPAAHIHRVRGEAPPEIAAAEASAELQRVLGGRPGEPAVLDLVFLGMGEDGHIASLFPGVADAPAPGDAPYRAVTAPKPPPARVTLDYGPLADAREVWVLASGPGKDVALRNSLSPEGQTPLARLLRRRPRTVILTDIAGVPDGASG